MKKPILILGICLALQAALALGVNLARTDYGAYKPMETLLSFDAGAVDGIRIEQGEAQKVVLTRAQGSWRVSSAPEFPADQDNVAAFLKKLAGLKKGWPVATTAGAAKRFKVAENDCERKITLSADGKSIATLFVGTSPGFRKIHGRRKGENAVYALVFNDYDAGAKAEVWIDKKVLNHREAEIARVRTAGFSLLRSEEGKLSVEGIDPDTEETDGAEAERLVRKIAELRIRSVLGTEARPVYRRDDPVFDYTLELSAGNPESYVFSKPSDADHYVLKASHRKEYFAVDAWVVDGIRQTDRSKLVRKKSAGQARQNEKS